MKTIYELWNELTNHPDYEEGKIWKLSGVS